MEVYSRLLSLLKTISTNRLSNNNNIYDVDSFSKALILSSAWNNMHTLADANSRYYFNPYTLKLEPITTDQGYWKKIQSDTFTMGSEYLNILSNQKFLDNLSMNLDTVNKTVSNISKHLSHPQSLFPVDKKKNTKIVEDNMKEIINNKEKYLIAPIRKHILASKKLNSNNAKPPALPTKQQASEFKEHLHIRHYADGTLELYNLIPDSVTVEGVLFNNGVFYEEDIIVPSYLSSPNPTVIKTPYKGILYCQNHFCGVYR